MGKTITVSTSVNKAKLEEITNTLRQTLISALGCPTERSIKILVKYQNVLLRKPKKSRS